jgi:pyridoxine kinase
MTKQKRALAVQDISCVGKCSLTVALPILSAAGVETSILPTSILSTHTGGFGKPTFRDLTGDILPIAEHWKSFGLTFDALCTGYLGSAEQVEQMLTLFDEFGASALKLVDPVMADHGKLYSGFTSDFPAEMAKLCEKADLIVPNFTEAALLLGEDYVEPPYTKEYAEGLIRRLAERFPGSIVLTGVQFDGETLGATTFDRATGQVSFVFAPRVPGQFHGTGDIFAAALLSAMLADKPLPEAAQIAANFTARSIALSDRNRESKYGVRFEAALPSLMEELSLL